MSPRAAAAAVARGAAATVHAPTRTRTRTLPRRATPPRRRSGAAAPPRTAARRRVIALPHYDYAALLDRILRGPLYIAIIGVLLAGIVFFNVDVLELNHGIARTDTRAAQLKRENAALTLQLAKLGSSERIQRVALAQGLVLPQPSDVRYLRARAQDAEHAVRIMTAPDSSAATTSAPVVVSQQSTPTSASVPPTAGVTPVQAGDTAAQAAPATTTPAPVTSAAPVAATPAATAAAPATTAQSTP